MSDTMFSLVIFLLSCSEYAFAEHDIFTQHDNTTCVKKISSDIYNIAPIPNEHELNGMCPDIIKYLYCYWNELQEDPDKYSHSQHFYYRTIGELLIDLCTDGSQIRQDYLSSQQCFKNVQGDYETCQDEIKPLYEQWKIVNPEDDPQIDELQCFLHSQTIGCPAHRINQTCGFEEYSTYMEILKRSRYVHHFCGPVSEDTLELEYLDLLKLRKNDGNMNKATGETSIEVYVRSTNRRPSSSIDPQSALIKIITYVAFWITLKVK